MSTVALTLDFTKPLTIEEKFRAFDEANPHVYRDLVHLCARRIAEGKTRLSIGGLAEDLRENPALRTSDPNAIWKINNSYRSLYARKIVSEHPEWAHLFELRGLRSA